MRWASRLPCRLPVPPPYLVEVIEDLLQSIRALPQSAEMRGRLAMAYEVNDFATAGIAAYRQAEALDGDDFRWPYFRAVLTAEEGDLEQALQAVDAAVTVDDGYVPAWLYRGIWLIGLGRYEEAQTSFEHARSLGANVNADAGIGETLLAQNKPLQAVAVLEPLSAELRHPHVYRLLARAYQALGRSDEAKIAAARGQRWQALRWQDPLQEQKWKYLASYSGRLVHAENLLKIQRYDEAIEVLEPMQERALDDEAVLSNLALAYARTGQSERAFEMLRKGFSHDLDHHRYHNGVAGLYHLQGDIAKVTEHLHRSIARLPEQSWPYERLGTVFQDAGRYDEAIEAYDKALEYGFDEPEKLLYTIGLLEGMAGRWPAAIRRFEQATARHAAFTKAYISLGRCLAEIRRFDEAREAFAWAERLATHPAELAAARRRLADLEAGLS